MSHRPLAERETFDEVNLGFDEVQAIAEAKRCLACGVCSECMACSNVCGVGAVNHDAKDELKELDVGAIIVASGIYTLYRERMVHNQAITPPPQR